MQKKINTSRQKSLVKQLKRRLFVAIGLLILVLFLRFYASAYTANLQSNLSTQKVSLHDTLNGLLRSMVDQETGLRGYISTNDPTFLDPFNSGRPQYLSYLQRIKGQLSSADFSDSIATLSQVEQRANDWYANFAQVQIKNMQSGNSSTARSAISGTTGKSLFDSFRASVALLTQKVDNDLSKAQGRLDSAIWSALISTLLASLIVVAILWRVFALLARGLRTQLKILVDTTNQLGSGDLSVRVQNLNYAELDQVGQTVNIVAEALQQQQSALKERDVLESVLELNGTLTTSLELKTLMDEFLDKLLTLLNLSPGVLYLYDPNRQQLNLFAAIGSDRNQIQKEFLLGDGTVGRTALSRKPLYLEQPTTQELGGTVIKSIMGFIVPTSMYYLPLLRGNDLLGVLAVGSVLPINEKNRNVLNVVISNLTSTISNTLAYQHIQEQARELEIRSHEQELTNRELTHQRDELTILNAALEEANRARSQFLSTMSHELRTPLASIIGFSQILLNESEKARLTQPQKTNLERILKNGKHLLLLINDVLDLAKIESGRMQLDFSQVELKAMLAAVVEETQSIAIGQKLTLQSHVEEGIDYLETDQMKLRQVLLNLVSNALKYTVEGEVTLTATLIKPSMMTSNHGTDKVAIAVKDTGIGIPPELQERIFEAFYQVDGGSTRKVGGTGLGLSIVRQLTTLLGGNVEVQSVPGQGSTFTIILPIKASRQPLEQDIPRSAIQQRSNIPVLPPSSNQLATSSMGDAPSQARLSMGVPLADTLAASALGEITDTQQYLVLAVDDNPDILQLIASSLEHSSYRVVGLQDPLNVMELVRTLHPSVITLDVMMPNLNGWQILYHLKNDPLTANIPIIILSVLTERTTGYILGADDYLIKPFKVDILLETLNRLVKPQKFPTNGNLAVVS
ncbi:MAG: hypothetical protein NVSMB27_19880 [Ktedonobacteraceae bacterium]